MQTFITNKIYSITAENLDRQRLGKQRVEAMDILYLILKISHKDMRNEFCKSDAQADYLWERYRNHPNVVRWLNHQGNLILYIGAICDEWCERGYEDNIFPLLMTIVGSNKELFKSVKQPDWITAEFCKGHQQLLLKKNPEYYKKIWSIETILV